MNRKLKIALSSALALGIAFGAGYASKPDTVKETVKYKEAKDVVIVKTKYVYPDGTTKEQTVTKDKTNTSVDSTKELDNKSLGVRVGVYKSLGSENAYGLQIQSPAMLSIFKTRLGLSAGLESERGTINSNVGLYVQF